MDFKDQVIFEKSEVVKSDGTSYSVFTPYSRAWKARLTREDYEALPVDMRHFLPMADEELPGLSSLGFQKTDITFQKPDPDPAKVSNYDQYRDFPALDHTTRLGIALRFGTISIRRCVDFALRHNEVWLSELIWREFFMQILWHFPKVVDTCFKPRYESVKWRNDASEFARWCDGNTGYPIVDAGMRQLNQTGYMHNRVRMIVAGFLTKHLLIDWRWGEAYFAEKLNDYELSSNNGNWQWAAGCGCDAAPYFRIFNPTMQAKKFDRDSRYIFTWCPEYMYTVPEPMVVHEKAVARALEVYREGVG